MTDLHLRRDLRLARTVAPTITPSPRAFAEINRDASRLQLERITEPDDLIQLRRLHPSIPRRSGPVRISTTTRRDRLVTWMFAAAAVIGLVAGWVFAR